MVSVDSLFDYGEERLITLVLLAGRAVIIAHAPRGDDTTARIDRMKDAGIDYSDIPPLDKSFFTKATEAWLRRNSN
jgi:hypothetical protein